MHILFPLVALASLAAASPAAAPAPAKYHACDPNAPSPYVYLKRQNAANAQKYVSDTCPSGPDCETASNTYAATYRAQGGRFFIDTYTNCSLKFFGNHIDPFVHLESNGLVNMVGYYYPANPDPNPEKQIVCNSGSTAVNNAALQCFLNANKKPISLYHCGSDARVYAFTTTPPASQKCVKQVITSVLA